MHDLDNPVRPIESQYPVGIRVFDDGRQPDCQSAFNGDPQSASNCDPPPGGGGTGGAAAPPGQPAGTNHPNPFYSDHHWLPFHRCTMRRSFYNQQEGASSDADSPFQGSSLQAFQHLGRVYVGLRRVLRCVLQKATGGSAENHSGRRHGTRQIDRQLGRSRGAHSSSRLHIWPTPLISSATVGAISGPTIPQIPSPRP